MHLLPPTRPAAPARPIALAALSLLCALGAGAPRAEARPRPLSCADEGGALRLCGAVTDNYKDCFNAVDGMREMRTWLQARLVRARGATWRIAAGQGQFGDRYALQRVSGTTTMPTRATLAIAGVSGGTSASMLRNGPPTWHFGPFVQLANDAALDAAPLQVRLVLRGPTGRRIATGLVEYRRDQLLHAATAPSVEANGPGGRWYVGGARTPTDVEIGTTAVCDHAAG